MTSFDTLHIRYQPTRNINKCQVHTSSWNYHPKLRNYTLQVPNGFSNCHTIGTSPTLSESTRTTETIFAGIKRFRLQWLLFFRSIDHCLENMFKLQELDVTFFNRIGSDGSTTSTFPLHVTSKLLATVTCGRK